MPRLPLAVLATFVVPLPALAFEATTVEVAAFTAADRDGDVRLAAAEFPVFIDAMAGHGQSTARVIRFFEAYDYAFSIADADGDGFLVPDELRAADEGYRAGQASVAGGR